MTTYEPAYQMPLATAHSPQQNPRAFKHLKIRPLSGALGASVTGIDLASLDDEGFEDVRQALLDHQVLTFPDQHLSPENQTDFAARFGSLMHYPFAEPLPEHPFITEILSEPQDRFNFGGGWHTDSMNFECPPQITLLQCNEGPQVGGDTSYTNLYMAWDSLSDGMRRVLRDMRVIAATTLTYGTSTAVGSKDFNDQTSTPTRMEPNQEEEEFTHPIARTHPHTARQALYLCSAYSARFDRMTRTESLPLMRYLWNHATQPEFTCRVSWRPGTLTIWDNRCCMHYAHNDYPGERRLMWRVIVQGEKPY